jgi:23S rRNA (cytidine2498-2'-O)-methyltransferase
MLGKWAGRNKGLGPDLLATRYFLDTSGFIIDPLHRVATFPDMLLTCQSGFETLLAGELAAVGAASVEQGPGWVRTAQPLRVDDLAFPHLTLMGPTEVRGESVNGLAQQIADYFLTNLRGERIESYWPCIWRGPAEIVGLGRRAKAVETAFAELLKKKLSRVAKLASDDLPRGVGPVRGLFVFFTDFGRAWVAREAWSHGQRRMADDDLAPSRSYLKVEEAYVVLGREPVTGESVCDLGAAPGGWSYSAAQRGARVVAIDNGPLKGGALNHPQIEHRCEDAFRFSPPAGQTFDWLFCDLLEEPHHVVRHIVEPWLERRWCRRYVINLKFGRVDAVGLLGELRAADSPVVRHSKHWLVRQLYHDREEFTLVGEVVGS